MRRLTLLCCASFVLLTLQSRAQAQPSQAPLQAAPNAPTMDAAGSQVPAPVAPPAAAQAPFVAQPYGPYDPRLATNYELLQIEHAFRELASRRPRLFWPVAMVAVGSSVALISSAIAFAAWEGSRNRRYGWDEQGNRYEYTYTDRDQRAEAIPPTIFTVIGLGVFAGGLALLIPRVRVRREEFAPELRRLQERRRELLRLTGYSLSLDRQRAVLSASVVF